MFLIDENLSRRLIGMLAERFPSATHVALEALERHPDLEVWEVARERSLILLTKDRDFEVLAVARGAPPKVVVVGLGNCTTNQVAELILTHADVIDEFRQSSESILILGSPS